VKSQRQHALTADVVHVDSRVGSRELGPELHKRFALKICEEKLPFADFAMTGHGPAGPLRIGIERKTLGDLVGSLLKNRLFGHQIPGLLAEYDLIWVVVEGVWRPGADDTIEVMGYDHRTRKRGWGASRYGITYSQLDRWLLNYDVMGQGRLKRWRTSTEHETCYFIADLARYIWKPWKKHHSHAAIGKWSPGGTPAKVMLTKATDLVRLAASLPGVGAVTARKMGSKFGSMKELVCGSEDEFKACGMKGKDAEKLWFAIRRRYR
jgi:ERCC4-type nuclease